MAEGGGKYETINNYLTENTHLKPQSNCIC